MSKCDAILERFNQEVQDRGLGSETCMNWITFSFRLSQENNREERRNILIASITDQPAVAGSAAGALDSGRDRRFLYKRLNDLGPLTDSQRKSWYDYEIKFSQIIENLSDDQNIHTFCVMVVGVFHGKYQRTIEVIPFNRDGPLNEYQHAAMIMSMNPAVFLRV
jgi:hypothetical protein